MKFKALAIYAAGGIYLPKSRPLSKLRILMLEAEFSFKIYKVKLCPGNLGYGILR